ncbi:MAG: YxiJ family protein [Blastocatellia bacterium]
MTPQTVKESADELRRIFKEELGEPFPYEDCRRVMEEAGMKDAALIPDLDLYHSDLAGYASWGKKILDWPRERILEAQAKLAKSFFDLHPKYLPLAPLITEIKTPYLASQMALYEKLRIEMLDLLSGLLSDKFGKMDLAA